MAVHKGRDLFVQVDLNDDGGAGADWVTIGQQRGGGIEGGTTTADGTHKDSGGWESGVATRNNWTMPVDGALNPLDAAYTFIRDKWKTAALVWVRFNDVAISGDMQYGQAWITSFSRAAPNDDVATFTIEFKGDGPLLPLPA
jgi:TP901-1 family phage major tail protein